ncbi:MAG: ComEC/Rec2 family competence protein [Gemmatimonadota bacterium]
MTVVVPAEGPVAPAGVLVTVDGESVDGRFRPWIRARTVKRVEGGARSDLPWVESLRWWTVRWRDRRVDQAFRIFGAQGPLVAALLFARREGLDPGVRDSFAAAGIAHLLAISGWNFIILFFKILLDFLRDLYRNLSGLLMILVRRCTMKDNAMSTRSFSFCMMKAAM